MGVIPSNLMAIERTKLVTRSRSLSGDSCALARIRIEERRRSIERRQRKWEQSDTGLWTHRLFPEVAEYYDSQPWTSLLFTTTQALTGHSVFRSYLARMARAGDSACWYCSCPVVVSRVKPCSVVRPGVTSAPGCWPFSGEPPSRKTSTTYSMADRRASYLDDLLTSQGGSKAAVRLHGGQHPHLENDGRASGDEALTGPVMMTDRGNREDDVERSHDDRLHTSIYIFCYFVLVLFYLIHLL